ncbi:hypothetical protein SRHO_G00155140 [Serrasalmus rhombeus]
MLVLKNAGRSCHRCVLNPRWPRSVAAVSGRCVEEAQVDVPRCRLERRCARAGRRAAPGLGCGCRERESSGCASSTGAHCSSCSRSALYQSEEVNSPPPSPLIPLKAPSPIDEELRSITGSRRSQAHFTSQCRFTVHSEEQCSRAIVTDMGSVSWTGGKASPGLRLLSTEHLCSERCGV